MPTMQNSETRHSGASTTLSKSAPQSESPSIASVQNLPQTNMGQKMTLQVCLPTQETIIVQFKKNRDPLRHLKRLVSQKMGLPPETDSIIILSYQGKSINTT